MNKDIFLTNNLTNKKEIFVPFEKIVVIKNDKKRIKERMFFPGYIMINVTMDNEIKYFIENSTSVMSFVGPKGQMPAPLREKEVKRIFGEVRRKEGIIDNVDVPFKKDDHIKVISGPFIDFNGVVEEVNKDKQKVRVIISIFAGRMGDVGKDPIPEFKKSIKMAKKFKNVEILWASTREAYNYLQARQLGCHIITVPPSIITKIEKFGKTFFGLTIDTVKGFLLDSKKSKFTI